MQGMGIYNVEDDVDRRIIDRLGERKSKMARMRRWEGDGRRRLYAICAAVSVAACIALFVVVNPFAGNVIDGGAFMKEQGIAVPHFGGFRAALPELTRVEQLIGEGKYYDALKITRDVLRETERSLKRAEKSPMYDSEEWMYEYESDKMLSSELRWTYIYLLVMLESEGDAKRELRKYLRETDYCTHRDEAERMLKAL